MQLKKKKYLSAGKVIPNTNIKMKADNWYVPLLELSYLVKKRK